jgi:hypothetical protein
MLRKNRQSIRQFRNRGLAIGLIFLLIFLAGFEVINIATQTQQTSQTPTSLVHAPTSTSFVHIPTTTKTSGNDKGQSDDGGIDFARLHKFLGSAGWIWRAGLPANRLVIYYGNPLSAAMGPIGAYSDEELITRLTAQAQVYAELDPTHPVVPALDYVTPVAQPSPMSDGSWVSRMPDTSIEHYANLANANHMLFFFDMQIGHSPIQKEVNLLWPYLERPGVNLSLDPEFDMAPGAVPGVEFGRMPAAEINWVIDHLSNLVLTQHLPPKILIIHQFLPEMLPDWQKIRIQPGVQIVTCVDGFGPPGSKIDDYRVFDKVQLIQYPGFKLFYHLDKPLMTPADVLTLKPAPLMVMYQ